MKTKSLRRWCLPMMLVMGCWAFVACVQEDPSYYRRSIPGLWYSPEGLYYEFQRGSSVYVQGPAPTEEGGMVWMEGRLSYQVNCCSMKISGNWPGIEPIPAGVWLERQMDFVSMSDSTMVFRNLLYQVEGQDLISTSEETWNRIQENQFADSLTGVWETVLVKGVPDQSIRLDFDVASTYDYYRYRSDADTTGWILQDANQGSWFNFSNQLILNTYDNAEMGQPGKAAVFVAEILKAAPSASQMEWMTPSGKWTFRRVLED